MKKSILFVALILLLCSHDMYLKLDSYFLQPNTEAQIQLFNGTFEKSENVIDRDRMLDASIVSNGNKQAISEDQWTEMDTTTTLLNFKTGESGTYLVGVSTKARNIEMDAEAFNSYLEHDGVKDMIEMRRQNNLNDQDAVEKYSKHVKAIFQVGDSLSNDWSQSLGYPIEFIPLQNPYEVHSGESLQVKLLRNGQPLANQLVYADYKPSMNGHTHDNDEAMHTHDGGEPHSHGNDDHGHDEKATTNDHEHTHKHGETEHTHGHSHDDANHNHEHANGEMENHGHEHTHGDGQQHSHDHEHGAGDTQQNHEHDHEEMASGDQQASDETHTHTTGQELRTNENGEVTVELEADGIWYLRTINLVTSEDSCA